MHELNIAGLKTHFVPAKGGSGRDPGSLVVLLHGYGAAGDDLVYLRDELDLPSGAALVFPEGPLDLGQSVAGRNVNARGWWPTDSKQFHLAMLTGRPQLASNTAGSGREAGRSIFGSFIEELQARFHVGPHRVVLGGFSQGSVLCLDWALHDDKPWAGLLCLSGTLVDVGDLKACLAARSPLRALVSHGRRDPILPFSLAQELCSHLQLAHWDADFVGFEGSHAIPPEVIQAMSSACTRWLSEAQVKSSGSPPIARDSCTATEQLETNLSQS